MGLQQLPSLPQGLAHVALAVVVDAVEYEQTGLSRTEVTNSIPNTRDLPGDALVLKRKYNL